MIIKIRGGVFETNSSSSHSMHLSDTMVLDTNSLQIIDGKVHVFCGEFGWGVEEYTDAATKAAYCLTWLKSAPDFNIKVDLAKKEQMLKSVIGEAMNVSPDNVLFMPADDKCYPYGYIDHQSIERNGGIGSLIFKNKENLANFIFNSESILHIDHDN